MNDGQEQVARASREEKVGVAPARRIYISGPMTGRPDLNFPAFNAEAARLRALGHEVLNPAEINSEHSKSWHACLRADVAALVTCDLVALLPGWEQSEGAQLEQHLAHRLGLEVKRAAEIVSGPRAIGRLPHVEGFGFPVGDDLGFDTLRRANTRRLAVFRNARGALAHSKSDGSDWTPAQWFQATAGELGEYANLRKKFERGDMTEDEFLPQAADELADVVIYLDLLAMRLGIDLGRAVFEKFNRVSRRSDAPVFLVRGVTLSAGVSDVARSGRPPVEPDEGDHDLGLDGRPNSERA